MSHQPAHIPRCEYPRPDFDRSSRSPESWLSLNGPWSFAFDDENVGLALHWPNLGVDSWPRNAIKTITVPFEYTSPASGAAHTPNASHHEVMWYARDVPWDMNLDSADGSELLLKFASVCGEECTVWINGIKVGQRGAVTHEHSHEYEAFEVDVTQAVKQTTKFGANFNVTVRVVHKNTNKGLEWESGGINGVVWLERVAITRITRAHIIPALDAGALSIHIDVKDVKRVPSGKVRFTALVSLGGREITTDTVDVVVEAEHGGTADMTLQLATGIKTDFSSSALAYIQESLPSGLFTPDQLNAAVRADGIATWTPEHPVLYDVEMDLVDTADRLLDRVKTHAGIRKAQVSNGIFHLNNEPYVQKLVLDQGYWPNSGLTAPDQEAIISEIVELKRKGFNGVRKHPKNQDPLWLYWADRLGVLVCSEDKNALQDEEADYVDPFTCERIDAVHGEKLCTAGRS